MDAETKAWVSKSERDYATMHREFRVADDPNYDDVCFHAQQCIEKLLKAHLQERQIHIPKSHDLRELVNMLLPQFPDWSVYLTDCARLSEYAVNFRYPGDTADRPLAERAVEICGRLRTVFRAPFGFDAETLFPSTE
jgi:HEPN domain-containing protein